MIVRNNDLHYTVLHYITLNTEKTLLCHTNRQIHLTWRKYVTIHHETSVKSPLGHFQFMLYLESTCPKL